MLITKIEKQNKNNKRYNLYIAGEFYFGLYDDTILKFGIAPGDDLTEEKLTRIREFDEYIYGKKISFDYLSYRIRTIAEIKKKLKSKDISPVIIDKVIHHLNELGLINDEEFAKQLITEKIKNKPAGKRLLQQKLFEKGISRQVSETAIEKYLTEADEKKMAIKIYEKLKPKLKGLEKQKARQKIYEALSRKGFDYDIINEIIREKAD